MRLPWQSTDDWKVERKGLGKQEGAERGGVWKGNISRGEKGILERGETSLGDLLAKIKKEGAEDKSPTDTR